MHRKASDTIKQEMMEGLRTQRLRFEFGTYSLEIPTGAVISAEAITRVRPGSTAWRIECGRHRFAVRLAANSSPADLAPFILSCTKQQVEPSPIVVNGISGVRFGTLSQDQQTDWWLKRGELMICISLFGPALRSSDEHAVHERFINSLEYIPATQG
jgi:hypothetical protein